jgi:hypothetical protein
MDANLTQEMEECVIQHESKKTIKSRVFLIVQTYLHNVDCVRDVHKTLMGLILRETLGVLAVEVCCDELRSTIDREFVFIFLLCDFDCLSMVAHTNITLLRIDI